MKESDICAEINYASKVTRYERFLAIRLIDSVQCLRAQAPHLCEQSDFRENWLVVEQMPAEMLFQAAAQPLLGSWLRIYEALTLVGAYTRYPNAQPVRHLKDFARVLLAWIGSLTPDAQGAVHLMGRQVFPLLSGRRLLVLKERMAVGKLLWRTENHVLKISLPRIGAIAEVDLADPHLSDSLDSQCFLMTPPVLGGLRFDVWTPEFVGDCGYDSSVKEFERLRPLLENAIAQLSAEQRKRHCSIAVVSISDDAWQHNKASTPSQLLPTSPRLVVRYYHTMKLGSGRIGKIDWKLLFASMIQKESIRIQFEPIFLLPRSVLLTLGLLA